MSSTLSHPLVLRPEVAAFAQAMERKLRANDSKGGWSACDSNWLLKRLVQETRELANALLALEVRRTERPGDPVHWRPNMEHVTDEAADVANFAMMIADVSGILVGTALVR